jgi:demethylmenaquinone methyltransferase / 2-methoxy-6-polyprenyl-1,4-benzoquinol methylase
MFDDISPTYDFLNHFLSLGIDRSWRNRLVWMLAEHRPSAVLDVATGTADLAVAIASLNPARINGIDISGRMLEIGKRKVTQRGLDRLITLERADAEDIPFPDESFDAVTVAFGVRNFAHLERGLSEIRRVLRPEGKVLILEFSRPPSFIVRQLFGFYSRRIVPTLGRLIAGNGDAYRYLHDSVAAFPSGQDFLNILDNQGLSDARQVRLSGGIASIYTAGKRRFQKK